MKPRTVMMQLETQTEIPVNLLRQPGRLILAFVDDSGDDKAIVIRQATVTVAQPVKAKP